MEILAAKLRDGVEIINHEHVTEIHAEKQPNPKSDYLIAIIKIDDYGITLETNAPFYVRPKIVKKTNGITETHTEYSIVLNPQCSKTMKR